MLSKTKIELPTAIVLNMSVSTMNMSHSIFHPYLLARRSQVKRLIAEWRTRARSRSELMTLSDRTLLDIGVSRIDAVFEASKPFWMA
jgi:uncharacterized protein YjiS (DUF1127 family)